MLRDRGCEDIKQQPDLLDTIQKGESPVLTGRGKINVDVYIYMEEKIGIKFARQVLEQDNDNDIVIVSIDGPTPFTRKECESKNIQFMLVKDVCVNKVRHHLVPRHEKVDTVPNDVPSTSLPKILESDPICQYYNWPIGTIVKISRVFGGHEIVPYYRIVAATS